jgi:hypothetical protein
MTALVAGVCRFFFCRRIIVMHPKVKSHLAKFAPAVASSLAAIARGRPILHARRRSVSDDRSGSGLSCNALGFDLPWSAARRHFKASPLGPAGMMPSDRLNRVRWADGRGWAPLHPRSAGVSIGNMSAFGQLLLVSRADWHTSIPQQADNYSTVISRRQRSNLRQ